MLRSRILPGQGEPGPRHHGAEIQMPELAINGGTPVRAQPYPVWPAPDDEYVAAVTEVVRISSSTARSLIARSRLGVPGENAGSIPTASRCRIVRKLS